MTTLGMLYVAVIAGLLLPGGQWAAAIYLLAYWHYAAYAAAYRFGAVAPARFRRDAVFLKTVSLAGLGWAYFAAPLDWLSIGLVAAGFALNAQAARVLGAERTYYGAELTALPPQRAAAFPYSITAHPMLYGNLLAYAGTLLNPIFRETWWPLALGHLVANVGLLVMEARVTPLRRHARGVPEQAWADVMPSVLTALIVGAGFGVALAGLVASPLTLAALAGGASGAYGALLYFTYSRRLVDRAQLFRRTLR